MTVTEKRCLVCLIAESLCLDNNNNNNCDSTALLLLLLLLLKNVKTYKLPVYELIFMNNPM